MDLRVLSKYFNVPQLRIGAYFGGQDINSNKEELNDSQAHVKAIKSFYANIDTALAGVGAATKEAEEFKRIKLAQFDQKKDVEKVQDSVTNFIIPTKRINDLKQIEH